MVIPNPACRVLSLLTLVLSIVVTATNTSAQSVVRLKEELVWSEPGAEIASAQFSGDGKYVLLVSRVHWPDGHEAEELPESYFTKLEDRKAKDPRFADPVIQLIDLSGNTVCEVRYGWNPALSPDGKSIAFARQKNPITGHRLLAETQAGNDIQLYNCETKQTQTVASSSSGYLDDPKFVAGGTAVAYTLNEAVNGAWGGPVALERVNLPDLHTETLLPKKLTADYPNLLFGFSATDGAFVLLEGKPIPAGGGMYLASRYSITLRSVFPKSEPLISFGQVDMDKLRDLSVQAASGTVVMIFSGYWRPFSLDTKSWLPDIGPKNANVRSVYSQDLKYYAVAEPAEEPTHFNVYRSKDGHKSFTSTPLAEVFEMTWSRDSTKLAVVALPKSASGVRYHEEVHIYSLQ